MGRFNVHPEIEKIEFEKNMGKIILETRFVWFYITKHGNRLREFNRKRKCSRNIFESEDNGFHTKSENDDKNTYNIYKPHIQEALKEAYTELIILGQA